MIHFLVHGRPVTPEVAWHCAARKASADHDSSTVHTHTLTLFPKPYCSAIVRSAAVFGQHRIYLQLAKSWIEQNWAALLLSLSALVGSVKAVDVEDASSASCGSNEDSSSEDASKKSHHRTTRQITFFMIQRLPTEKTSRTRFSWSLAAFNVTSSLDLNINLDTTPRDCLAWVHFATWFNALTAPLSAC